MCSLIAPQYFDDGATVLESACDNICHWPALIAGEVITLYLLGNVYQTIILKVNSKSAPLLCQPSSQVPSTDKSAAIPTTTAPDNANLLPTDAILPNQPFYNSTTPQLLSSVHEIDIFCSLFSVLSHVHLLWELVLTAEPIVVMGASPTDCSSMVQSLMR